MRTIPQNPADRLIVALDVPDVDAALAMVQRLDGAASFFKVGMWLLYAPGVERLLDSLINAGRRVFLDAKMYDIPETVAHGVAAAAKRGVTFATIHGDPGIISAAVQARAGSSLQLMAVTVLTSLDDAALSRMGYARTAAQLVAQRAREAAELGCDGIIASAADNPNELRRLAGSDDLLIVTPGIRPAGSSADDQKRIATPGGAIRNGADYLVVGRPIIAAPDPAAAAHAIVAEMAAAIS